MKTCPVCDIPLTPMQYENLFAFGCNRCHGYLLSHANSESIRRNLTHSEFKLATEAQSERAADTTADITCPRCRLPMEKESRSDWDFAIDVCRHCTHIWYDGGELAKMQIAYERTPRGRDARNMAELMEAMSPDEEAALQEKINKLPDPPGFLSHIFRTIFTDMLDPSHGTAYDIDVDVD